MLTPRLSTHLISLAVEAVAKACLPTHNTNIAISGASAVAAAIGCGIRGEKDVETLIERALEAAELGLNWKNKWYGASIRERTQLALDIVYNSGGKEQAMLRLYNTVGAGVSITETVPSCLAIVAMCNTDPWKAFGLPPIWGVIVTRMLL